MLSTAATASRRATVENDDAAGTSRASSSSRNYVRQNDEGRPRH